MFLSTIIPTIGRPTLPRAINSVLGQEFEEEEFEVVVVNDTGRELPQADWQNHPNVRMITTNRLNRCIARNTGAAIAKGEYLHFLDDDDLMLPGAFESFWKASKSSSAAWYHGAFSLTDNAGDKIVDVFPEESNNCFIQLISWEWLPLQASIIDANAFFKVGGFEMLEALKGGFEDIDLSRKIARYYDFMNIPNLVASIRAGDVGSTTNYGGMFIQNRRSRENALDMTGAFQRLVSSAQGSSRRKEYWHGRMVYCYMGSAVINMKQKRLFTAISRALHALASLLLASRYILKADFWRGLLKPHYTRVWMTILESEIALSRIPQWN